MPSVTRKSFSILAMMAFLAGGLILRSAEAPRGRQTTGPERDPSSLYLGFDRNGYPGDAALALLRQTFSFSGYWLNVPPGDTSNTWQGKREVLIANGFGFLVLFNGRLQREFRSESSAKALGARDALVAIETARKEGFPAGTIIFLDQEEGGRMLSEQQAYVYAWVDGVDASGYRAGIYCSGIAVKESRGATVTTANDLQENAGGRKMVFFVYNDSCPPSPGCAFPKNAPPPAQGGVSSASIWQFAQSPRRRKITASCPSRYDADGSCYAPLFPPRSRIDIDVESATSPDPSSGRG